MKIQNPTFHPTLNSSSFLLSETHHFYMFLFYLSCKTKGQKELQVGWNYHYTHQYVPLSQLFRSLVSFLLLPDFLP